MTQPAEFIGHPASPGQATGPVFRAETRVLPEVCPNTSEGMAGMAALAAAVETAIGELRQLALLAPPDSTAMLEFQIEFLLDPAMLDMVTAGLQQHEDCARGWMAAMDAYIAGFDTSDDESIRARAVDILDIRNRVLDALAGRPSGTFPAGSVYVGRDIEPSLFLGHDWSAGGGIALSQGSTASHVAMLARARGVPMIVGLGEIADIGGAWVMVDADAGRLIVNPTFPQRDDRPACDPEPAIARADHGKIRSRDGVPLEISINLNDPRELAGVNACDIVGIGLVRSEFLLRNPAELSAEEAQYTVYRELLDWAAGKSVAIRLFDFGGDKRSPALLSDPGSIPGLRGIRLLLARPELLGTQLRALLRARCHGPLRILLPMVTIPAEVEALLLALAAECTALHQQGMDGAIPPVGMMVEVPAAALMLDCFPKVDFFSFGTNDLGQYLAGAARDLAAVMPLLEASRPALYRLLSRAVGLSRQMGVPVTLCGDMAADPACLGPLLACGIRHFSVAPVHLRAVKAILATLDANGQQAAID
nr:putative PEP-binding protein [uncultured Gellertiella sp.]